MSEFQEVFAEFYDSIAPLKTGGQALLYRARRIKTAKGVAVDQKVAIKLYLDPNEDARIDKEILAAREAKCESLVKVISSGKATIGSVEYKFVIWEYIDGMDLDTRLQVGPCSPALVALIGRDVCLAIEALWQQRIVHRDINPKNIMLRQGDEGAVLIDLGIAKHLDHSALTALGLTWGTQGYLSPEQANGSSLTCQSDIFSLGVTLQYALHGSHPTQFDQARLLYDCKATHQLCPNSPAALANILDRMLEMRSARRPQLAELVSEFGKLVESL